MLHLECFDPHEPFSAPARFRERHPTGYTGPILDWPRYKRHEETALEVQELRANYAALLSMCEEYFGRLLDYMDRHFIWEDTTVILTTDHGFNFTQGVPLLKVPARRNAKGQPVGHTGQGSGYEDTTTVLFDLIVDPAQLNPIRGAAVEQRLMAQIGAIMEKNDAPPEAFLRLDLAVPAKH